uniref:SGNH domain-containing protein n=1 Tax=Caenorhabditis japonica TaxID=281687 RepID=A0A8R1HX84_CAEJA
MFNERYKEIRLFARHGSAPLLNIAPYFTDAARQMAKDMKPELLWIIQGMNEIKFHDKASDAMFAPSALDIVIAEKMNEFKKLADLIYVDLPYYLTADYPAKFIARSLIFRKNLEESSLVVPVCQVEEQIQEQTQRLLRSNCANCHFNDIQKALTNGSRRFYFYDRENYRALNYDGSHLTLTAFKYIRPIYSNRIEQFFRFLAQ